MLPARKIQTSFGESMPMCILNAYPRTPTEDTENNRRLNQSSFLSVITSHNYGCYSCQELNQKCVARYTLVVLRAANSATDGKVKISCSTILSI